MPLLCRNSMERAGSHPGVPGAAAGAVPPPGVLSSTCTSKQLIALPLILDYKNNKSITEASNPVNSFRVFSHVIFNSSVLGLLPPSLGGKGENPNLGFSAGASLRGLGQAAKFLCLPSSLAGNTTICGSALVLPEIFLWPSARLPLRGWAAAF